MKKILLTFSILVAALIQGSFLSFYTLYLVKPNLILILIALLVVRRSFTRYWPYILFAALLLDLLSGWPLGSVSLGLVLAAFTMDWLKKDVFGVINLWTLSALIAIGTLTYNVFLMGLVKIFDLSFNIEWFYNLWRFVSLEIGYNIILTIIIFYGLKKIQGQKQ